MDEKPFGDNPFGDNPFMNSEIKKENAGFENGDDKDKDVMVCPQCGMPLMGEERYCMGCGMNVQPVSKAVYESAGAGGYGGTNQKNYTGATYHSSSAAGIDFKTISLIIIMAVSLIMAGFFIFMGIKDSKKENVVVAKRTTYSDGKAITEEATIYATGDKIYKISDQAWMDISGMDQRQVDIMKNYMNQYYMKYTEYSFIQCDVTQEDNKIIVKMDYNYLNVMDNMSKMIDLKMLDMGGRSEVTYKDYISLKKTISYVKSHGWTVQ